MTIKKILIAVFTLGTLTTCATMDRSECLAADWYAVGFEDGSRGYKADRIGTYRKDCAEHGVTPSLETYLTGRDEGLITYCTASNGLAEGKSGRTYQGVCPDYLEADFLHHYRIGKQFHDVQEAIDEAKNIIRNSRRRLKAIQAEIHDNFVAWVKERRGDKLKGTDKALFSGEFWTGAKAQELGLIDGLAEAKSEIKRRYGDKVKLIPVGPRRRPFSLPGMGAQAELGFKLERD